MKDFFKGKLVTALVVVATIILAGVAIFSALRLYQLRQEPAVERPEATAPVACEILTFTISTPTLTPTGSLTPTLTTTLTPTVTLTVTPTVGPTATLPPDTTVTPTEPAIGGGESPTPTLTPTRTATATPGGSAAGTGGEVTNTSTPTPGGDALPSAGSGFITIAGFGLGILLITAALLLAI